MSHKARPIFGQGGGGRHFFLLRIGWGFYGKNEITGGRTKLSNGAVSPLKKTKNNNKKISHLYEVSGATYAGLINVTQILANPRTRSRGRTHFN